MNSIFFIKLQQNLEGSIVMLDMLDINIQKFIFAGARKERKQGEKMFARKIVFISFDFTATN